MTEKLKKATDVEKSKKIIDELKNDPIFQRINEEFNKKEEEKKKSNKNEKDLEAKEKLLSEKQQREIEQDDEDEEIVSDEIEELKKIFFTFFVKDAAPDLVS